MGEVARETGIPVIFEVLATETLAQAEERSGGAHGNKGWDAAEAALEMADLLDRLPKDVEEKAEEKAKQKANERAKEKEGSLR